MLPNITKDVKYETTTLSTTINRSHILINPKDDIDPNTTKPRETEVSKPKIFVKPTMKSTTVVHVIVPITVPKTSSTKTTYKSMTTTTKHIEITKQYGNIFSFYYIILLIMNGLMLLYLFLEYNVINILY